MTSSQRSPYYILLALIFVAGAGLRMGGLAERGLHTHDEGRFLIVADSYLEAGRAAMGGAAEGAGGMAALGENLRRRGGSFFAHAKEGHVFLLAAWRAFAGRGIPAAAFLSVVFSLGAALMLYRLISDWTHKPGPGVVAAAALLLSPLFLHYSRGVLSEADSLFFLLAAFLTAHRAWCDVTHTAPPGQAARRALLAGALAGAAFACHYNKALAITLFAVIWIAVTIRCDAYFRPRLWKVLALMAAGFAVPLLLIQAATMAVAWRAGVAYPGYKTYFGDLWYHFMTFHAAPVAGAGEGQGSAAAAVVGANPLYGLALLIDWRGWVGAAAIVATLMAGFALARRREKTLFHAASAMLVPPFVFFSLYRFQVERSFVGLEAAWAAVMGAVWWSVAEKWIAPRGKRKKSLRQTLPPARLAFLAAGLCAALAVITIPYAARVVRHDASTFQRAARALTPILLERGGRVTAGSVTWHARPQWIVYLNEEVDKRLAGVLRAPLGSHLADYVDWSVAERGDYLLIEDFDYPDSPLFPPELTAGRAPSLAIPAGQFTPAISIFDLRR